MPLGSLCTPLRFRPWGRTFGERGLLLPGQLRLFSDGVPGGGDFVGGGVVDDRDVAHRGGQDQP